jgi:2'-5' RNA ligase
MSSGGDEKRQRLFFALWPDEAVRATLDTSAGKLLGKRVKRVVASNLHITLAFAGPVSGQVRRCLETAAGDIRVPCFELCINRVGHWPGPRILWVGPTHIPGELWSLAGALRQALEDCGIDTGTRSYQPHVTLARKVSTCPEGAEFPPVHWSISQFSLVESVTDPAGVRYRVLRSWALGSA